MAPAGVERDPPSSRMIRSADGTSLGLFSIGAGPAVVIVPGAMSTAADYFDLAKRLARMHTVYILERRGRGASGPQGPFYSLETEIEDLGAVLASTGATAVFGHSYGGLVAFHAALRSPPRIERLALYEPGLSIAGSIATDWVESARRSLDAGKELEAFARFSIAAGPPSARRMPIALMKLVLRASFSRDRLRKMLDLLPTTLDEHRAIGEANCPAAIATSAPLRAETLVMYGGRTQLGWLPGTVDYLHRAIPSVEIHRFDNLDHFAPTSRGCDAVADLVGAYFGRSPEAANQSSRNA